MDTLLNQIESEKSPRTQLGFVRENRSQYKICSQHSSPPRAALHWSHILKPSETVEKELQCIQFHK